MIDLRLGIEEWHGPFGPQNRYAGEGELLGRVKGDWHACSNPECDVTIEPGDQIYLLIIPPSDSRSGGKSGIWEPACSLDCVEAIAGSREEPRSPRIHVPDPDLGSGARRP